MPLCQDLIGVNATSMMNSQGGQPNMPGRQIQDAHSKSESEGNSLNIQDLMIEKSSENGYVKINSSVTIHQQYAMSSIDNSSFINWNNSLGNSSAFNNTTIPEDEKSFLINELQLIKVIVLVIVVSILLLSTCKIVLKTFSRYSGGGGRKDDVV